MDLTDPNPLSAFEVSLHFRIDVQVQPSMRGAAEHAGPARRVPERGATTRPPRLPLRSAPPTAARPLDSAPGGRAYFPVSARLHRTHETEASKGEYSNYLHSFTFFYIHPRRLCCF